MFRTLFAMPAAQPPRPPAAWPAVRMIARVHTGLVRTNNEDAVSIHPEASPWPVAVLADGMGGYNAGEVASAMAVSVIPAALQHTHEELVGAGVDVELEAASKDLQEALCLANAAIREAARETPGCQGMGTTVVAAAIVAGHAVIAHLGDSRAYAWRTGQLTRLTRDHSLVQQEMDAGHLSAQDAQASGLGHLVTRALGVQMSVDPELNRWPLQAQDRLMLCSDGVTDMLDDSQLEALFAAESSLPELLTALLSAANAAGGRDNISVVLMEDAHRVAQGPGSQSTSLF